MKSELKKELIHLISKSSIKEVFDILSDYIGRNEKLSFENEFIKLSADFSRYQELERKGTHDVKILEQLRTKVLYNLIQIVQEIPEEHADEGLPFEETFSLFKKYYTNNFVGREHVFSKINNFINQNKNGYVHLEGTPGIGKSAIMAKLAIDNNYIYHAISKKDGITRTDQFLESICKRILFKLDQNPDNLPEKADQDGSFLRKILGQASKNTEPFVILIDALDELDTQFYRKGTNILYLPSLLANNIYFVLSSRHLSSEKLSLEIKTPSQKIDLDNYSQENRLDVINYVQQVILQNSLQAKIDSLGYEQQEFVEKIIDSSENNFMYIKHIIHELETGDFSLSNLPKGLESYYESHWHLLFSDTTKSKIYAKIIYALAQQAEPVSIQWLSGFLDLPAIDIQLVLNDWRPFLFKTEFNGTTRFSLYHASFQEFIKRKDIVKAARIDLEQLNDQLSVFHKKHLPFKL